MKNTNLTEKRLERPYIRVGFQDASDLWEEIAATTITMGILNPSLK
jgi:hypothetical protein